MTTKTLAGYACIAFAAVLCALQGTRLESFLRSLFFTATLLLAIPFSALSQEESHPAALAEARALTTTDAAEITRRWGPWVHMAGRYWAFNEGSALMWFSVDWVVPGAAIELLSNWCRGGTCKTTRYLLVHSPNLSENGGLWNLRKFPAFEVWSKDFHPPRTRGIVWDADSSQHENTSYQVIAGKGVKRDAAVYQPVDRAALEKLAGEQVPLLRSHRTALAQGSAGVASSVTTSIATDVPEVKSAEVTPVGLKSYAEALFVCTRPDPAGRFRCDAPDRLNIAGVPGARPEELLAASAVSCPSRRRLASLTHVVWGCGFGATGAPSAMDVGQGVDVRGRGTYQCLEGEAACKRTKL